MTKSERAELLRKLDGFTERQRKRTTKRRRYFRNYLRAAITRRKVAA